MDASESSAPCEVYGLNRNKHAIFGFVNADCHEYLCERLILKTLFGALVRERGCAYTSASLKGACVNSGADEHPTF